MGEFHRLVVLETEEHSPALSVVRIEGGPVAASFTQPGQYVKMRRPGQEAERRYAMASHPGAEVLELLVKRGSEFADWLCEESVGLSVEVTAAQGPGFPLALARGRDLILVAAGTGVAPIRPVIQNVLADRDAFHRVALYYGEKTPRDFAFADELAAWATQGIEIHRVVSRARDVHWTGARGHAQDVLLDHRPHLAEAVVFVCGQWEMEQACMDVVEKLGGARENVYTNHD